MFNFIIPIVALRSLFIYMYIINIYIISHYTYILVLFNMIIPIVALRSFFYMYIHVYLHVLHVCAVSVHIYKVYLNRYHNYTLVHIT